VPVAVINHAINEGVEFIGENRVQEFLSKKDELSTNVHRHFIGHLQTNKVKDIVNEVEMIHSVHSVKLAKEIDKQCKKHDKCKDILLEVNIGNEDSKSGFSPNEIEDAVLEISKLPNVCIKGLMTIPPICGIIMTSQIGGSYYEYQRLQSKSPWRQHYRGCWRC
jgi:pyridoxal phosphate enzyme (YggS family)